MELKPSADTEPHCAPVAAPRVGGSRLLHLRLWLRAHGRPKAPKCAGRGGGALSSAFGAGSATSILQTGEMVPHEEARFGSFNRAVLSR